MVKLGFTIPNMGLSETSNERDISTTYLRYRGGMQKLCRGGAQAESANYNGKP
ncbi:hypothetical protein JCM19232_3313 [Vibrio ishigakensis]|uniref:Uncharacterized protein n=1 Tax=Vibrio ishigakensis TaxID=1481914 RepID=A0A0B8PHC8_9VIBR|nr:hypothetical protein JCM19232_3313 [Vibrio ishigakensis]